MTRAQMADEINRRFREHPVVPALRTSRDVERVSRLSRRVVFLLGTSLSDYRSHMSVLHEAGHAVFVHLDLVEGLKSDAAGFSYLLDQEVPEGIISTHKGVLDLARKQGLLRILRVFMLDSEALGKGRQLGQTVRPDFIELLPGAAVPGVDSKHFKGFSSPLIAGGLITTIEQVHSILGKGVLAVSTSESSLW